MPEPQFMRMGCSDSHITLKVKFYLDARHLIHVIHLYINGGKLLSLYTWFAPVNCG